MDMEGAIFPCPCHHKTMGNENTFIVLPCSQFWGWFTHTCANRVGSVVLPEEVQGQFSQVSQLMGFKVGFPTILTKGSALSPASGIDRGRFNP